MTTTIPSPTRTTYEYHNPDGSEYCQVVRVDKPNGKDIFTLPSGLPGPHPPYRAERLATLPAETPIYIVEGEKCVEALEGIGLAATTSKGGSNGASKTDWEIVSRFRRVILLPDADAPGAKYSTDVIGILADMSGSRRVEICELPGLPVHGDVADYIELHGLEATRAAIEEHARLVGAVCDFTSPANGSRVAGVAAPPENISTRLVRDLPEPDPYPIEALGRDLCSTVDAISDAMQVPQAMAAQSILAAVALAVQQHGNCVIDGRVMPASLFCMTVAISGDRKSAVDAVALRPHREWQDAAFETWRYAKIDYEQNLKAYNAAVRQAEKRKGRDAIEAAIKETGDPPEKPLVPSLLINNMTSEGLHRQLSEAMPYAGVFSDEAGSLIGGHAMTNDNMLRTLSEFSALWGLASELRVRAGNGMTSTAGKRLSMHLMCQPDVAGILFGKRLAHTQGFVPRLLIVWPESLRGTRRYRRVDLSRFNCTMQYEERISDLLNMPAPRKDERPDCLDPRNITLTPDAMKLWIRFHDDVESQNAPGKPLDAISGWASKAAEHAARIATVLSLYDNPICEHVTPEAMANGIVLAQFYMAEMHRVHARGEHEEATMQADDLLRFMQAHVHEVDNTFSTKYLLQYGPNRIRDAVVLQDTLEMLRAMNIAAPIEGRGKAWRVL